MEAFPALSVVPRSHHLSKEYIYIYIFECEMKKNHIACFNLPHTHILLSSILLAYEYVWCASYAMAYRDTLVPSPMRFGIDTEMKSIRIHNIYICRLDRGVLFATFEPRAYVIGFDLRVQPSRRSYARRCSCHALLWLTKDQQSWSILKRMCTWFT